VSLSENMELEASWVKPMQEKLHAADDR
jgi:hypothetical protein